MDARSIIARLRKREEPTRAEITWFVQGLADQSISDAQVGAFSMAICMGGLGAKSRAALTMAMRDTGHVLEWDLDGPVVDKHSTGGVGDCVSFVLAPALAACGAYVPLISGRCLGHTGGTLDKMEAIPGVSTSVSEAQLKKVIATVGCAIVGASADIAPADKRLYAIRDVTSTVDSLDLIAASILSKKLAAAANALVLDVKVGSGAFMKSIEEARALAEGLTATAKAVGCPTRALITDMNQPLATSLGNALEIAEAMRALTGQTKGSLIDLVCTLGGSVLADAGAVASDDEGAKKVAAAIADGSAAERFGQMIAGMGGPLAFADNWSRFLPEANVIREVEAGAEGYVTAIDGEALGFAVVALGGGRQVESDRIDPAVGLSDLVALGARVDAKTSLAIVRAAREDAAQAAEAAVRKAIAIGSKKPKLPPLIHERIG